jgi:preprotein translocase subunit YajC
MPGTRVVVTTSLDRGIHGRLTSVDENTLEVVSRRGRDQTLRREDVREVRLDPKRSVGQHVGLHSHWWRERVVFWKVC